MKNTLLLALCAATAAPFAASQKAILFTGRFPFVSVDAANNSGSIPQMSEFDFSYALPLPGSTVGRTLMAATAMHAYLGDGDLNGDYLKFDGWKPSYFTNVGIDGLFVKHGVTSPSWQDVYWTPRLDAATTPMEVLTNNGTPTLLAEGDWVRFLPNGNVEFFLTQAQLAIAAGPQVNNDVPSAGALVQSSTGDLYYAPGDGGHWVNGNSSGQVFVYDGAILKIDAANITYDSNGNVQSLAPNSARVLLNEIGSGPGGTLNVRVVVDNAFAYDRTGQPIQTAGVYGKTGGLALDPNGGTFTPSFPDSTGAYPPEPNLAFCSNAGSYGGTIFTTANNGDVLEINAFGGPGTGVLCGSKTPGVPADGSWLGVQLDIANFQPTLLGMTICDLPQQPLTADVPGFGRLPDSATQADFTVDFHGIPSQAVFGLVDIGPTTTVVPSLPISLVPLSWHRISWSDLFLTTAPISLGIAITDGFGYTSVSIPNPNPGGLAGFTLMVQGVGLRPGGFELSSPVLVQLQ
ncbi:MAG: hypothetical protein KAI24_02860 [Planctomycetes bacterium]|nr:hypothetical protein [Planctomycetota bacterium]